MCLIAHNWHQALSSFSLLTYFPLPHLRCRIQLQGCETRPPPAGAARTQSSSCIVTCWCYQGLAQQWSRSGRIGLQKCSQRFWAFVGRYACERGYGVTDAALPGWSCSRIWLRELIQKTEVFMLPPAHFYSSLSCPSASSSLLIQHVRQRCCSLTLRLNAIPRGASVLVALKPGLPGVAREPWEWSLHGDGSKRHFTDGGSVCWQTG